MKPNLSREGAENQYLDHLSHLLAQGSAHDDRTGVGTSRFFGEKIVADVEHDFPLLTTKKIAYRWVVEELLWFLRGSTNEQELSDRGVSIWAEWATAEQCAKFGRPPGELGPVYGHQFRNYGATIDRHITGIKHTNGYPHLKMRPNGVDQLRVAVDMLLNSPGSRRIIINLWNPAEATEVTLPPCHVLTQFSVIEGHLHCQMYQRSADIFLGVPYNLASYATLMHILAKVTGLKLGHFHHVFGDLHLYSNHQEAAKEQLRRLPRLAPQLDVNIPQCKTADEAIEAIEALKWEDFKLTEYNPHPKISAPVAV